jgi:NTP pyrophosphatase (non-canonical NTP hydrolase)
MELNEYQQKALTTSLRKYSKEYNIVYPALGLGEEAGEVMGKIKKWLRGDDGPGEMTEERRTALKFELGDVLWYLAVLANDLGLTLEEVARANNEKLQLRKEKGTLMGDGDKR